MIDLGRALHVEGFVRTLVVEDFDEVVEACLLLQEVGRGRLGGFFLEGEMHAFMAAVLLVMSGLNAFHPDPQAKPPDGELAQVEQGMGGSEGHAVIAADVGRQAAFLKKPLKYGESIVFASGGKSLASQQKTAGVIGDGQRIAVLTIAEPELALVIGAPQFIGTLA